MDKLKRIGKGGYTTAYKSNNNDKVYLQSTCMAKEAMALGWYPFRNSRLFPKVELSDKPGYDYMMPYYPPVKSLKQSLLPAEYDKYIELRRMFTNYSFSALLKTTPAEFWLNEFRKIKNRRIRVTLMKACQTLRNYGDRVNFEISPRNVRVKNGKLILLDCFFINA